MATAPLPDLDELPSASSLDLPIITPEAEALRILRRHGAKVIPDNEVGSFMVGYEHSWRSRNLILTHCTIVATAIVVITYLVMVTIGSSFGVVLCFAGLAACWMLMEGLDNARDGARWCIENSSIYETHTGPIPQPAVHLIEALMNDDRINFVVHFFKKDPFLQMVYDDGVNKKVRLFCYHW